MLLYTTVKGLKYFFFQLQLETDNMDLGNDPLQCVFNYKDKFLYTNAVLKQKIICPTPSPDLIPKIPVNTSKHNLFIIFF